MFFCVHMLANKLLWRTLTRVVMMIGRLVYGGFKLVTLRWVSIQCECVCVCVALLWSDSSDNILSSFTLHNA